MDICWNSLIQQRYFDGINESLSVLKRIIDEVIDLKEQRIDTLLNKIASHELINLPGDKSIKVSSLPVRFVLLPVSLKTVASMIFLGRRVYWFHPTADCCWSKAAWKELASNRRCNSWSHQGNLPISSIHWFSNQHVWVHQFNVFVGLCISWRSNRCSTRFQHWCSTDLCWNTNCCKFKCIESGWGKERICFWTELSRSDSIFQKSMSRKNYFLLETIARNHQKTSHEFKKYKRLIYSGRVYKT